MRSNSIRRSPAMIGRRGFLAGVGSVTAWAYAPRRGIAATSDPRFAVVILRGAMDGLALIPPVGDPDYSRVRGDFIIGTNKTFPLDGFFALNAAMPQLHERYKAGELLVVHAAATSYRQRSHFDGQDVLESGFAGPNASATGWLNRAVSALPAGERARREGSVAATTTIPLILRGTAPVLTWTAPELPAVSDDTIVRLIQLYEHTDPELVKVLSSGYSVDKMAGSSEMERRGEGKLGAAFARLTSGLGRLLAQPEGPRVAVASFDGWDTHSSEGGRLGRQFAALDTAVGALYNELRSQWANAVVLVVTEFGRTVAPNGTAGTDHGTATTALLFGGGVKGGRVLADWPGLKADNLHEGRDLKPTLDLRAIFKGILKDHLGLSEKVLSDTVFPDSRLVQAHRGLFT